ncbi:hypothetical protein F5Y14DRAFT_396046 [Nemania sp. NC0429]|nr:hypothetical protein F5Y14DRAFT_396046 [Nemania sp. NC0429]
MASQACQTCGATENIFACFQCNDMLFCHACWEKWVLHVPGASSRGGKLHEKIDPVLLQRLRHVFEPIRTEAEHGAELEQDRESTWFGFDRDSSGHPTFVDHGRFTAIMTESITENGASRFPRLVSFIGETGAGKSSLIKLLIDRQGLDSQEDTTYWTPVTSSNHDYIPTTGDVHLYAEPSSFYTHEPLLFADCEGLNGGEALPKALRQSSRANNCNSSARQNLPNDTLSTRHGWNPLMSVYSSRRSILWAKTPLTKKREFSVQHLYPKILYTFSDVVVFVTRNPRSFESTVLDKLIQWGAASLDTSLNQPVLPHAIIAINATDKLDAAEWEIETSTERLMTAIEGAIYHEPGLQEYVQTWNKIGKTITDTKQLLECYYSSITVIRIPTRSSYTRMDIQAERLFNLIKTRCTESQDTKRRTRFLADAERMQEYLQSAFDQFTRDLDAPFDFVKASLRRNPVPRNFEGNILRLAMSIKENSEQKSLENNAREVFRRLAPMVASCIMFDAARLNLMGTAPQLLKDAYSELCMAALRSFANEHWPCTFENPSYGKTNSRCCNFKNSHTKGHQNIRGKLIGNGSYQADFEIEALGSWWIKTISEQLTLLQNAAYKLGQTVLRTDIQIATILHRERMNNFYSGLGNALAFISHAACFSCLRELPECILPCGHILCQPCVQAYGRQTSRTAIEVSRCPLHVREPLAKTPHVFSLKPFRAGFRVLSLDGGGVGALVELCVLRAIQKLLGPKLPIQKFFDLIVGTSAGGLIALGLGTRGWSVDEAISKFKSILKEVFKPRDISRIPFLEGLATIFHGNLYKTQAIEDNFKREFSDELLFGGRSSSQQTPKVAVTSSSIFGEQATIFANYNRPQDANQSIGYHFLRPDTPWKELRTWEAARATFAVPQYFKSFCKSETNETYIASTMDFACPAWVAHQEAQLIWNDTAIKPDISLSIGTGRSVLASTPRDGHQLLRRVDSIDTTAAKRPAPMLLKPIILSKTGLGETAGGVGPEELWDKFVARNLERDECRSIGNRNRYIRINPPLNIDTPKFDDVKRLDGLEREADEVIYQDHVRIKEIAHRLLASSFFFEKNINSVRQISNGGYKCSGSICCRFQQGSSEVEGLGHFLHACVKGSFTPYFVIEEQDQPASPALAVFLTEAIIRNVRRGYFDLDIIELDLSRENSSINISLCLQTVPYSSGAISLPISGFPRELIREDSIPVASSMTSSAFIHRRSSENDSRADKSGGTGLVLLSKVPQVPIRLPELPEPPAPTPELEGKAKQRSQDLFEMES